MSTTVENPELNETSFEINDDDYIRNIIGLHSDWIEFLRFETEKKQVFEIGSVKDQEKSKEFSLKIRNFDIPVLLFGALDLKKGWLF